MEEEEGVREAGVDNAAVTPSATREVGAVAVVVAAAGVATMAGHEAQS